MNARTLSLALLILAAATQCAPTALAGGGKPTPPPSYPIKVTFDNLPGVDRILSVGDPTYTNGDLGVKAHILGGDGRVRLGTQLCTGTGRRIMCGSSGRTHYFDYTGPETPGLDLPTTNGWSNGTITTAAQFDILVFDDDGTTNLLNGFRDVMDVNKQRLGSMKVNFSDSSGLIGPAGYTLRFNPNFYPQSNYVLVTFLGGSLPCGGTVGCAKWTVEALNCNPTDPTQYPNCKVTRVLKDVAALPSADNSLFYGTFHMPFRITVEALPTLP